MVSFWGGNHLASPSHPHPKIWATIAILGSSQKPPNPEKFKVAQKWLKSDFRGLPQRTQKSPEQWHLTQKVTRLSHFSGQSLVGSLLNHFVGDLESHLFSHCWATLNFSGFGVFLLVPRIAKATTPPIGEPDFFSALRKSWYCHISAHSREEVTNDPLLSPSWVLCACATMCLRYVRRPSCQTCGKVCELSEEEPGTGFSNPFGLGSEII